MVAFEQQQAGVAHLVASPRPQLPVCVDCNTVAGGGAGGDEDDGHVAERRQHMGHNQVVGVLKARDAGCQQRVKSGTA